MYWINFDFLTCLPSNYSVFQGCIFIETEILNRIYNITLAYYFIMCLSHSTIRAFCLSSDPIGRKVALNIPLGQLPTQQ